MLEEILDAGTAHSGPTRESKGGMPKNLQVPTLLLSPPFHIGLEYS